MSADKAPGVMGKLSEIQKAVRRSKWITSEYTRRRSSFIAKWYGIMLATALYGSASGYINEQLHLRCFSGNSFDAPPGDEFVHDQGFPRAALNRDSKSNCFSMPD